jgi:hypothetical protein
MAKLQTRSWKTFSEWQELFECDTLSRSIHVPPKVNSEYEPILTEQQLDHPTLGRRNMPGIFRTSFVFKLVHVLTLQQHQQGLPFESRDKRIFPEILRTGFVCQFLSYSNVSTADMFPTAALLSLSLLAVVSAQQVGTNAAEVHPALSWQACTSPTSCTTTAGKVVLDANWRWLHTTT